MGLWWPLLVVIPDTGQEIEAWPRGAQLVGGKLGFQPVLPFLSSRLQDTSLYPLDWGGDGAPPGTRQARVLCAQHGRAVVFRGGLVTLMSHLDTLPFH